MPTIWQNAELETYTDEELMTAKHNFELPPPDKTVISVDYRQSGVGSNSCGPALKKSARFDEDCFRFNVCFEIV